MKKKIKKLRIISAGSPPDIDSDFPKKFRHEVIRYTQEKYGYNNVAALMTPGPFKNKNAWKSMCTINGVDSQLANKISELIPSGDEGDLIADYYYEDGDFYEEGADLRLAIGEDLLLKKTIEDAIKLNKRQRELGVHACGIVISKEDLSNTIPQHIRQADGMTITQFDYMDCEALGLIKMDYLGLNTLDIIQETIESVRKSGLECPNTIDIINSDLNDPEVFKMFQNGDSFGIFQFSKDGVRQLLREVQPTEFMELAAITALYRPGPMGMGLHSDFARRKNDESARVPVHPAFYGTHLEEILSSTLNALVFQEQVLKIATECASFTSQEADKLRKAMGKKKLDILMKYEAQFFEGLEKNGYANKEANRVLWEGLKSFASYAFNLAHSVSYALNSYQAAYLKVHFPVHFMATLLRLKFGADDFSSYCDEAYRMGIEIIAPDINYSNMETYPTKDGEKISYGLMSIKKISDSVMLKILEERDKNGLFKNLTNFLQRCPFISASILKNLAGSGCLDSLGISRKACIEEAEQAVKKAAKVSKLSETTSLFNLMSTETDGSVSLLSTDEDWCELDKLTLEASYTGMFLSSHPLDHFRTINGNLVDKQPTFEEMVASDQKSFTQYISFMKLVNKKSNGGQKSILSVINNKSSQIEIKISGKVIDGITLKNAIDKNDGDIEKAISVLGKNFQKYYKDGKLNIELIDAPKPFILYKAQFKKNYGNRLSLVNFEEVKYSNNNREIVEVVLNKDLNIKEDNLERFKDFILKIDKNNAGSGYSCDIRIYTSDFKSFIDIENLNSRLNDLNSEILKEYSKRKKINIGYIFKNIKEEEYATT